MLTIVGRRPALAILAASSLKTGSPLQLRWGIGRRDDRRGHSWPSVRGQVRER